MSLRPIFYDTETTGISAERDRIIEIAAYDSVNQRSFVKLVNPGISIPSDATAIHGITNDMVKDASSFGEVAKDFIKFCEGEVVLIAHNNDSFDLPFLKSEFQRHQIEMPSWKFLDSLKWARRYRRDLPKHSLQFLREMYSIQPNNAHRALDDVMVLHQVFHLMIDDLPMEQVFVLLNTTRELTQMPFGKHQGKPFSALPPDYVQWLAASGALEKAENSELRKAFVKNNLIT